MATTVIDNLKAGFRNGGVHVRLIYLNVAVFVAYSLVEIVLSLFNLTLAPVFRYLELPASFGHLLAQPWSIITYMFAHTGLWHIVFNMLLLYWFGELFLYSYSAKHLRGLYLLGGMVGGLCFMAAYHLFPAFRGQVDTTYMLGASAAVLAIVIAIAYRQPNYRINLLFVGQISLKYVAIIVIALDLFFIKSDNSGGHIAHLGGALAGFGFAYMLNRGTDLTKWINGVIDGVARLFSRKPSLKLKKKSKDKSARPRSEAHEAPAGDDEAEIDRILDKIRQSGYQNLTEEEKKILFTAGKKS